MATLDPSRTLPNVAAKVSGEPFCDFRIERGKSRDRQKAAPSGSRPRSSSALLIETHATALGILNLEGRSCVGDLPRHWDFIGEVHRHHPFMQPPTAAEHKHAAQWRWEGLGRPFAGQGWFCPSRLLSDVPVAAIFDLTLHDANEVV